MAIGGDVLLVTTGITVKVGLGGDPESARHRRHRPAGNVKPLDVTSLLEHAARRGDRGHRGAHHHRRLGGAVAEVLAETASTR